MPGWENGSSQELSYASQDYSSDPSHILRSVKQQEAQFDQLTREFEADKLIAVTQINRSRLDSETASLNSISETNESFSWRRSAGHPASTMDEGSSFVVDVPSSNLLDSCLRELDERQVDDTSHMETMQYADPYASPYNGSRSQASDHDPYGTSDYAPHPYQSRDYEPQSDYGSPQHSNYQEYPPSEEAPGGYSYTPPPSEGYNGYGEEHRESFRQPEPQEDPYASRERYEAPPVDDSYRAPSPIGPDPYSSLPRSENPYQASPGYKEFSHAPTPAVISPIPSGLDDYGNPWDDYPLTSDPEPAPKDQGSEVISPGVMIPGVNPLDNYDHPRPASIIATKEDPYVSSRPQYDDYATADNRGHDPEMDERSHASDPFLGMEKAESDTTDEPRDLDTGDGKWRAPDLQEVIDYLGHPNQSVVAHAAGYIQHLSYQNDVVKTQTREMGGIQPLVGLLGNPVVEIHRSACGSLRNLSYGKPHEENKVKIKANGGIPALARLVRTSTDSETKDLATGTLWNLSSSEPLKRTILEDALSVLVNSVLIPESGWRPSGNSPFKDSPWSKTFVNATGCLRNVSSAGHEARHRMRECSGLVDSLLHVLHSAITANDMDNKVVENTLCILRNLTFRIANEANHPDAIPARQTSTTTNKQSTKNKGPESGSLICFGGSKKKDAHSSANGSAGKNPGWNPSQPIPNLKKDVKGVEQLWQPAIVTSYLSVLTECSNPASLEAAVGTIQNISAGDWQWSMYIRAEMRKEKGLPILVELLRMKNDRVMIAVAKALRNLALDPRNKDLIGKYGMQDLVERLPPSGGLARGKDLAPEGLVAVLNTMLELVTRNQENAKSLRSANGIERLVSLNKTRGTYPAAVIKASYQVLHLMWRYKDLRPQYKKDGWEEKVFTSAGTFNTLPRKNGVDGALPPTASDPRNNHNQPPAKANTAPANVYRTETPPEPRHPAPLLDPLPHPQGPPPAFDDPYQTASPQAHPPQPHPPSYDERSVDRDYAAVSDKPLYYQVDRNSIVQEDELVERLHVEPLNRHSVSTINSQELRLDERSVPAEEISLQPVGSDYADNPYASTSHQGYGRVQAPDLQMDPSGYSHINRSVSSERYIGDYSDYSTAARVDLEQDDQPAGDSWV